MEHVSSSLAAASDKEHQTSASHHSKHHHGSSSGSVHSHSSSRSHHHSSSTGSANTSNGIGATYHASSADYMDLVRGEGEWRNIQEIFRKSFKYAFDHIDKQQNAINQLVDVVGALKSQLASKASAGQIDEIFASKVKSTIVPASREEIDEIRQSMADIKAELQRKSTIRYVDDSLRRKVDKTDLLVKSLNTGGNQSYVGPDGALRMSTDFGELKARCDAMSKSISEITDHLGNVAGKNDTVVLREQVNECFKLISERPTRAKFDELMAHKVEATTYDAQMSLKSDKLQVTQHLYKQDALLSEHERSLTALKLAIKSLETELTTNFTNSSGNLNVNNPLANLSNTIAVDAEMDAMWTIPSRPVSLSAAGPHDNQKHSSSASSASSAATAINQQEGGGEFWSMIAESRNSSIIQNLFHNVKGLSADIKRVRESEKAISQRLLHVETTANNLADIKTVETIGLVLEEQKHRIDSIITGTTVISDVRNELDRLSLENVVVREFLGITNEMSPSGRVPIPEKHALTTKLKEFGQMLEAVGNRLGEVSTALGRAAVRLEAVEKGQRSNSTRIDVLEDVVPKFELVSRICNLSGSKYETLNDIANHLKELAASLRELQGQFVGLDSKSTHFINEITTRTSGVFQDMNKLDAKMASLHENVEVVNDNEIYWQKELKALKKMVKKILLTGNENVSENETKFHHLHSSASSSRRGTGVSRVDEPENMSHDTLLTAIAKSKAAYDNILYPRGVNDNFTQYQSSSSAPGQLYDNAYTNVPQTNIPVNYPTTGINAPIRQATAQHGVYSDVTNPNFVGIDPIYSNIQSEIEVGGVRVPVHGLNNRVNVRTGGQSTGNVTGIASSSDDVLRMKGAKLVEDLRREKSQLKSQMNSIK